MCDKPGPQLLQTNFLLPLPRLSSTLISPLAPFTSSTIFYPFPLCPHFSFPPLTFSLISSSTFPRTRSSISCTCIEFRETEPGAGIGVEDGPEMYGMFELALINEEREEAGEVDGLGLGLGLGLGVRRLLELCLKVVLVLIPEELYEYEDFEMTDGVDQLDKLEELDEIEELDGIDMLEEFEEFGAEVFGMSEIYSKVVLVLMPEELDEIQGLEKVDEIDQFDRPE